MALTKPLSRPPTPPPPSLQERIALHELRLRKHTLLAVKARRRALMDFYIITAPEALLLALQSFDEDVDDHTKKKTFIFPLSDERMTLSWVQAQTFAANFILDHPYFGE